MDITPEVEELNKKICQLPIIKSLEDNDALIMEKLGHLEIGQSEIEERLDEGAGEFKLLWSKVDSMEKSIDKLSETVIKGVDDLRQEIFDSKLDAALKQNTITAQENQELKSKLEKLDAKAWDIKKIIIGSVIGLVILGLGVALGWKS